VCASLPIRFTWSDPNYRSKHFLWSDKNPTVELIQYIRTPGQPQIGCTYQFLDTSVTVDKARFEYPDWWGVTSKVVDLSQYPLKDDNELYERLMQYVFEKGWEMPSRDSLCLEMKTHPDYFNRYREFLQKRILFVKIYRESSFIWNYWSEKSKNPELTRAISDAHTAWSFMPSSERDKLPDEIRNLYRKLISRK
jgi:hypothetical protein